MKIEFISLYLILHYKFMNNNMKKSENNTTNIIQPSVIF